MNAKYSRYLGLDIHRNSIVVGGVDADQRVAMVPRRIRVCNVYHERLILPPHPFFFIGQRYCPVL